ncbi:hypothetical protein [Plantactinospora sp. KBS50]|uniref:hypothetical protein n=1 Tax=Plantactinospora sp. KBS50 TaxID=2024580 RepID=UPI000BAABF6D|nr:hypothetical protein [Plantactinospora sp. KBS50]ASW56954.1 hypothetical protein CIK06_26555 [Plantactinospora sp. KBS50]
MTASEKAAEDHGAPATQAGHPTDAQTPPAGPATETPPTSAEAGTETGAEAAGLAVDRIDFGDIAQRIEMDSFDPDPVVEPLELVDAPVPVPDPPARTSRRRGSGRYRR